MTAIPQRDPCQGVLQILRFNRPKYLAAAAVILAAMTARALVPPLCGILLFASALPVFCWTVSSLLASHYVYDRSHFYELSWLARAIKRAPQRWLSIHCGLDETSPLLAARFPAASGCVVDIFDPRVMTEDSIRQARNARRNSVPAAPARFDSLPFAAGAFDTVFCIFAAHELRRHADRVRLFVEVARVLAPGGVFVLVEHLRDWPNFLAFGPGFLHFHSWGAWQRAAHDAGLVPRADFPYTRFVRVAIFGRSV